MTGDSKVDVVEVWVAVEDLVKIGTCPTGVVELALPEVAAAIMVVLTIMVETAEPELTLVVLRITVRVETPTGHPGAGATTTRCREMELCLAEARLLLQPEVLLQKGL